MPAKLIGRFEIIKELGRGAQGVVYLARDPQLERQVAIKTLRRDSSQQIDKLLHEARIASKLQHTHIIPLYDAGEQDGSPYLVYAYIEGETLAQSLKRSGAMPTANAARIAASVLDGLACAHGQGVMHLDIKPANVMLGTNARAMVMDFGIARIITQQPDGSGEITGTPQYMAPECISADGPQFSSDQFSVGMMLYEMVTGTPVVEGGNIYQILHRNAHEKAEAPSSRNVQVDEKLEGIILKAITKKPEERYADALAMRQALLQYLDATAESKSAENGGDKHSTLEFLLRRMRSKSDFPALSGIITEINKIVSSESESASKLAQTILQDFALTNKLLKLVNTVSYGQFGGNINTISKAVVILGFETVRNIAMSLILLEFLQNKSQALEMKDEVIGSFFAGIIAARLSPGTRAGDAEESMICAMFHNLGRMLAKFYFFEESQEVMRLMADQGMDEEHAAIKVLGLSYNDLGVGVAKSWNFPGRLVAGMQKLPADKVRKPASDTDQMCVTVNMANELCAISAVTDPRDKESLLSKLTARYAGAAQVSEKIFSKALESSLQEFSKRAVVLGINTGQSPMLKKVRQWSGHAEPAPQEIAKGAVTADAMSGVTTLGSTAETGSVENGEAIAPKDAEAILGAGIQDVTNTLVGDYELNDVLRMVLETIYRSLGFKHVLIMIRDNKQNQMLARFGFGEHVDALIPRFRFSLVFEPDVFHLAVDKGLDIVIEDVRAENIASKIPAWFHATVDSQCFLLLPVMVNKKTIGLIYADMQAANSLQVTQQQLALLRTLRNQAILAIKQKMG
jgi:eukaryotic-like serine/threonine-protein kinase